MGTGPSLRDRIVELLDATPVLTDREITNALLGHTAPQQPVNQLCRSLAASGVLVRQKRADGKIGNSVSGSPPAATPLAPSSAPVHPLSEDGVKRALCAWLSDAGWQVHYAWGKSRGVDIDARRDGARWLIEVKGQGSLSAMRVNYFLMILGELLQRMDDPTAHYSFALPDLPQYRGLWGRLPELAKTRTEITALFVDECGSVHHEVGAAP